MINPFHSGSSIVHDSNLFVGRKSYLTTLERFAFSSNLEHRAILGEPKIGKTSLIQQAILAKRPALHAEKIFPFSLDCSKCRDSDEFFFSLLNLVYRHFRNTDDAKLTYLKELRDEAKQAKKEDEWDELTVVISEFFTCLKYDSGCKIILILDEFDAVRELFANKPHCFAFLRTLGDNKLVSLLLISRREVRKIERRASVYNSKFHGLFDTNTTHLSLFDETDWMDYRAKFKAPSFTVNDDIIQFLEEKCGRHPYLLNVISHDFFSEVINSSILPSVAIVERIFNGKRQAFVNYYNHLVDILKEDNRFEKMLRIVFDQGTVPAEDYDISNLIAYGIIYWDKDLDEYRAFSDDFENYLYSLGHKNNFWSIWQRTEVELRSLIKTLSGGNEDWRQIVFRQLPSLQHVLYARHHEDDMPSPDLSTYLKPREIFDIILHESNWSFFQPQLGGTSYQAWEERFNKITEVRDPVVYNRYDSINRGTMKIAEEYCQELYDLIKR